MPTNLKIYDGSTYPDDHITRYVRAANQGEWETLVWCRMFQQTLDGPARGWFNRLPNGCIEIWTDLCEMYAERFALRRKCSKDPMEVPWMVTEMMKMVDDFVKLEEAYKSTELPKGEHLEKGQRTSYRGDRPPRAGQGGGHQRTDNYNTYGRRDHYDPYVPPRAHNRRYDNRKYDNRRQEVNQLSLDY
ncbi:hypothetical protein Tco_1570676 [Tanacetum coccineum]